MRFSLIAVLTLAAATRDVLASHCQIAEIASDCCWGGNNGKDACLDQRSRANVCRSGGMADNFCRNVYRPGPDGKKIAISETCKADCCSTITGEGMGCPK
ncbi:hypothetical protein CSHISOI_05947 [Colletotrichum shisoi]|uniref:Uncharacterized protein n=1 Tax=Colletotrichum shisoi TaxID=2078593 RepID=A0A5Q4BR96_9PEZI|nr:hypothetical protein CSHISOI_05947 [Colletotrichum shisoi]